MITIDKLEVDFRTEEGWFRAVKGISFSMQDGEVVGIVGESGSGKSVTSLSIMRLHDMRAAKMSGSIRFNDTELLELSDEAMRLYRGNRIAMIFQEPMTSLNPVLTCGYQVAEAIRLHRKTDKKTARQVCIDLFKEVQLPRPEHIFDSYPHQLSGGQKQRVMIAMALSCDPEVLIADEPTTALDVTVQKTILQLLLRLKKERNMSMIFITHDLGVISEIADRVIVMYKGDIVEEGKAMDVFSDPQHPYTRGLLACRPSPERKLKVLPVVSDFTANPDITVEQVYENLKLNEQEVSDHRRQLYTSEPLLKVEQLKTWFPVKNGVFGSTTDHVKAVDEVSLELYPGETLGLVGESGCGKTTLGRSILRLVEPTSGKIIFNGQDITLLNTTDMRAMRRDMQIIFQDPYSSLNPRLTIGQSITEPMKVHGLYGSDAARKDKAIDLLTRVNLGAEHYNRYPHEFSGGQRQRICIARALALQPKFIICDESVSALDVSVQAQVLNLIRNLQQEFGLSYIFISHDLAVVKHISDRMIVMNKGRIEEAGDPDEIYHHPKSAYTQKLIDAIPGAKTLA